MDNRRQQLKGQVKKHLPEDWLCEIRIAYRILMEAVNDIKRTGIINLVIITTMAAILTIFGILFRFTLSLSLLPVNSVMFWKYLFICAQAQTHLLFRTESEQLSMLNP